MKIQPIKTYQKPYPCAKPKQKHGRKAVITLSALGLSLLAAGCRTATTGIVENNVDQDSPTPTAAVATQSPAIDGGIATPDPDELLLTGDVAYIDPLEGGDASDTDPDDWTMALADLLRQTSAFTDEQIASLIDQINERVEEGVLPYEPYTIELFEPDEEGARRVLLTNEANESYALTLDTDASLMDVMQNGQLLWPLS